MKLKINADSGKKHIVISGIGTFRLGEVYELDKKKADVCLKKTVSVLNPLNKEQTMEVSVFVEVKDDSNSSSTKDKSAQKGGTSK